jgi:hypothetical protein
MATLKGVKASDATLSRPYLFFIIPIMAMTWGFLALCVLIGGIVWIRGRINIKRADKSEDDLEQIRELWSQRYHSKVSNNGNGGTEVTRDQMAKLNIEVLETLRQDLRAMKSMTLLSLLFGPISFIASVLSTFSLSLPDAQESIAAKSHHQFFLIPESNGSLSNLDQVLALTGGILMLLWATRAAYWSRKDSAESLEVARKRRRSI